MKLLAWCRRVLYIAGRCFPTLEAVFLDGAEDRLSGRWLKEAAYDRDGDVW